MDASQPVTQQWTRREANLSADFADQCLL